MKKSPPPASEHVPILGGNDPQLILLVFVAGPLIGATLLMIALGLAQTWFAWTLVTVAP